VQLAARLCQAAEPDGIIVSEAVRALVPDRSDLFYIGALDLKGFPRSVNAYGVRWD
jgi:class 3 adenylate cyclase